MRELLERLVPGIDGVAHPRDPSEERKPARVLAVQLAAADEVLPLGVPSRGRDYRARARLVRTVDALAAEGRAVVVTVHDVAWAARWWSPFTTWSSWHARRTGWSSWGRDGRRRREGADEPGGPPGTC